MRRVRADGFMVFGGIAVTESVRESWIGEGGDVIIQLDLLGEPFQITVELLMRAGAGSSPPA